jgi:hypothetical protein
VSSRQAGKYQCCTGISNFSYQSGTDIKGPSYFSYQEGISMFTRVGSYGIIFDCILGCI